MQEALLEIEVLFGQENNWRAMRDDYSDNIISGSCSSPPGASVSLSV